MSDLFDLNGKTIIVTGAGSGIGQGVAIGLANRGARVFAADINEDGLADTQKANGDISTIKADISDETAVEALFDQVLSTHGQIDVVFANAGISGSPKTIDELEFSEWRRVIDVNTHGTFLTARSAARRMKAAGQGKIILTASTWGIRGTDCAPFTAYAASKGAVVNLTRQLALELASSGVTVNAIAPGGFATNMANGVLDEAAEAALFSRMPMRKFVEPAEMVGPAVFLASAASDYITGVLLPVDGGYLAA